MLLSCQSGRALSSSFPPLPMSIKDFKPFQWIAGIGLLLFYLIFTTMCPLICMILFIPSRILGMKRQHTIMKFYLAHITWESMLWVMEKWGAVSMKFSGDPVPFNESALIVANHQVYYDWLAIMALAGRRGLLAFVRFFVKDSVKYLPGFGWSVWTLDWIFVKRSWANDKSSIEESFKRMKEAAHPSWLIIYPEGTRYTEKKFAEAQAHARKIGKEPMRHVLWPRTKGFVATVKSLRENNANGRPCISAVYDFTIGYEQRKPPSVFTMAVGACDARFHIHVRRWPINELPQDDEKLRQWCVDRFREKDELMDRFFKSNNFSDEHWDEPFRVLPTIYDEHWADKKSE